MWTQFDNHSRNVYIEYVKLFLFLFSPSVAIVITEAGFDMATVLANIEFCTGSTHVFKVSSLVSTLICPTLWRLWIVWFA